MGVKSDGWIKEMAELKGMIEPFEEKQVRHGISYGLSSYGYDFRIDRNFKIFDSAKCGIMDPKMDVSAHFRSYEGDVCEIPPNSYVLAQTVEYFRIPRDLITICH
mgnify:CR=1 FL=1